MFYRFCDLSAPSLSDTSGYDNSWVMLRFKRGAHVSSCLPWEWENMRAMTCYGVCKELGGGRVVVASLRHKWLKVWSHFSCLTVVFQVFLYFYKTEERKELEVEFVLWIEIAEITASKRILDILKSINNYTSCSFLLDAKLE